MTWDLEAAKERCVELHLYHSLHNKEERLCLLKGATWDGRALLSTLKHVVHKVFTFDSLRFILSWFQHCCQSKLEEMSYLLFSVRLQIEDICKSVASFKRMHFFLQRNWTCLLNISLLYVCSILELHDLFRMSYCDYFDKYFDLRFNLWYEKHLTFHAAAQQQAFKSDLFSSLFE